MTHLFQLKYSLPSVFIRRPWCNNLQYYFKGQKECSTILLQNTQILVMHLAYLLRYLFLYYFLTMCWFKTIIEAETKLSDCWRWSRIRHSRFLNILKNNVQTLSQTIIRHLYNIFPFDEGEFYNIEVHNQDFFMRVCGRQRFSPASHVSLWPPHIQNLL